ncbi:MAG: phage tail protein [Acidimicrobiales bacterium]
MTDVGSDRGASVFFSLTIDSVDLGSFISCDGLGMEMNVEEHEEGGSGAFVRRLPGRYKFTNLKLTRPVSSDTKKVLSWLNSMAAECKRTNAQLKALSPDGKTVFEWTLTGVLPARWTGPSFDASSPKVATESLELAYEGLN